MATRGVFSAAKVAPFSPSVWFPPLFPGFLAVFDWLGASLTVVTIFQSIIGAVTALLVYVLARMAVASKWAVAAALFYSLHPGAISISSWILTETLFTVLLLGGVCFLAAGLTRNRLIYTSCAGALLALATLCRSVTLLLPLALIAMILVAGIPSRRRHIFALVILFVVVIAPWSIRSTRVAGRFTPVQDSVSIATLFYAATRVDWDQADQATLWPRQAAVTERLRGVAAASGSNVSQLLFREGWQNIKANPTGYFMLRVRTFPYFVLTSYDSFSGINRSLRSLAADRDAFRLLVKIGLLATFSFLPFVLGIIGLGQLKANAAAAMAATTWLYMLAIYLPLWNEPRYWLPAVPFLLVSATLGARLIFGFIRARIASQSRPQTESSTQPSSI